MTTVEIVLFIGIIFFLILIVVIFLIPTESRLKKKRRRVANKPPEKSKDWKETALRLEQHIHSKSQTIVTLEREAKARNKALLIEKAKVDKVKDKLKQERGWQQKELGSVERQTKELQVLKNELRVIQDNLGKEHSANIRLRKELEEVNKKCEAYNAKRRAAEAEVSQFKTHTAAQKQEISHLKKDVAELSKKKQDTQWVAKTEYLKLERELKETEKSLQRKLREAEQQLDKIKREF